jgi:phospholipid/cholesterol/gamma-HCH transport system substrate-binding protein
MRRLLGSGLAIMLFAVLGGCSLPGSGAREITAMLGDGAGLYVGNDVGVLGVPVGKVTKVEPAGKVVKVTLKVTDPDIKIPADAAAVVVSRSVATDRYVELTPVYHGGVQMPSGAVIPLERTRTPVDFDEVLGSMSELASDLTDTPKATNSLSEVLRTVAAAFTGSADDLNSAVHGLAGLVDTVHGQRSELFDTMDSLDELATKLVDNKKLIETFVENLGDALDLLNSERDEVGHVLRALQDTLEQLTDFSRENRGAIKASVKQVTQLLQTALRSRADLGETLEVMPLATENIARSRNPENNHIWVRTTPAQVLGLEPLFEQLCQYIGPVCNLGTFPNLSDLLGGSTP